MEATQQALGVGLIGGGLSYLTDKFILKSQEGSRQVFGTTIYDGALANAFATGGAIVIGEQLHNYLDKTQFDANWAQFGLVIGPGIVGATKIAIDKLVPPSNAAPGICWESGIKAGIIDVGARYVAANVVGMKVDQLSIQ